MRKTKIKRPLSIDPPSFQYGILMAAQLASEYDGSSIHPYRLGDCILAKLNLLDGKPRKNKSSAKIEAVLLRLEHKVASLEGTMRFMTRKTKHSHKGMSCDSALEIARRGLSYVQHGSRSLESAKNAAAVALSKLPNCGELES